jgi:hypothetical protein
MNKKYILLFSLSLLLSPVFAEQPASENTPLIEESQEKTTTPKYAKLELREEKNGWDYKTLSKEEEEQSDELFKAITQVDVEAVRACMQKGYNCNVLQNSIWFFTPLSFVIFFDATHKKDEVDATQDRRDRVEIARILLLEGNAYKTMYTPLGNPIAHSARRHSNHHPAFHPLFDEAQPRFDAWLKENGIDNS